MICKHRPNISFFQLIFHSRKNYRCIHCNAIIKPRKRCHTFVLLTGGLLLILGIVFLYLFINRARALPIIIITEGVIFWIVEGLIYKYGPYELDMDTQN